MFRFLIGVFLASYTIGYGQSNHWLPKVEFNPKDFVYPKQEFGPMARWWWPGNDVSHKELKREINLFADNAFAGVEIQTIDLGIPFNKKTRNNIKSWDSPEYYENVRVVMQEALKRNLIIDMTNGSGWPVGGSFVNPDSGFHNLKFKAITLEGGKKEKVALQKENPKTGTAILQGVVATRVAGGKEEAKNRTIPLMLNSTINLTKEVEDDSISLFLPEGTWQLISYWSLPTLERAFNSGPGSGYVVDHFDKNVVNYSYDYLFGDRTGLSPYFGKPLRAIFNDSYEFKADRHFNSEFKEWFKKHRGYDPLPYFAANMQKGYNFVEFANPHAPKDFTFSEDVDERLRYDYDITLSELLAENFLKPSRDFTESRGMLHRTQTYGMAMDILTMAGLASIPEMESMLASEANLKVISSGAHLNNRPIVSAESVVFAQRAYMTTPQKTKISVDKLLAAGANQIIFHGVPYSYYPENFAKEGWFPFSTASVPAVNFSSHYGENDVFWGAQKPLNEYIQRSQYALRSGKPKADVLIYFPFLKLEHTPENPEELLTMGELVGIEPPLENGGIKEQTEWSEKTWRLINLLEAKGISWDWVNDLSILEASLNSQKKLIIRGNEYQGLIFSETQTLRHETAIKVKLLTQNGLNLFIHGNPPHRQPSFLNYQILDMEVENIFKELQFQQKSKDLNSWLNSFDLKVKFLENYSFTRQTQREMEDGSHIHFIWNKSKEWQTIQLKLSNDFKESIWLDAVDGSSKANGQSKLINYRIPPYGSIILYASTKYQNFHSEKKLSFDPRDAKVVAQFSQWDISNDSFSLNNTSLIDWKNHDILKKIGSKVTYKTHFKLKKKKEGNNYFLDLGNVYFTADLKVNGQNAGSRIFAPYSIDIDKYLKRGKNDIEVVITPSPLNSFIAEAENGNKHYRQFEKSKGLLISNGLVGPVLLYSIKK